MDAHIEVTESPGELAERLAQDAMYQAICTGNPRAMARLQKEGSIQTTVDLRKEAPIGQRQVESLLRFMVSKEIERDMEDAEGDNVVYDGLREHRVLGKKK